MSSGKDKFYGWISLSAAALVYFLMCGVLIYPFGVFLPVICEDFGWSRGVVAGAFTVQIAVLGMLGPLTAVLITRVGPRMSIILGNVICGAGLLLLAFHRSVWQLYVGYGAIMGIGLSIGGFLATTTIANNWFFKKRSLALSIVIAAGGIGGLILVPAVMKVIGIVGWRTTYLVMLAVVVLFSIILPGLIIRNKPEDLGQVPDGGSPAPVPETASTSPARQLYATPVDFTFGEAVRTRAYWLLILLGITHGFAISMVIAHQVAFLVDMGISAGVAATALGLIPGTSTIGRLGIGFLSLRYNMRPLAIIAVMLVTVGMGLVLVTRSLPMVFVYTTCFGIGFGAGIVAMISLYPIYFGRAHYTRLLGFTGPFSIIAAFGAPLAGAMYDTTGSYLLPFTIGFICLIVGLVCLLLATPPRHPSIEY